MIFLVNELKYKDANKLEHFTGFIEKKKKKRLSQKIVLIIHHWDTETQNFENQ